MSSKPHGNFVGLSSAPEEPLMPGEDYELVFDVLPQNYCPNAITQIYIAFGLEGTNKHLHLLYDSVPGASPDIREVKVQLKVPERVTFTPSEVNSIEIAWCGDLQYSWADAMHRYTPEKETFLESIPVASPIGDKHNVRLSLVEEIPTEVEAGTSLVIECDCVSQNYCPNAITQIMMYFTDVKGGSHVVCIDNVVPGDNPEIKRGGVVYYVDEELIGNTIEIGWARDLQYNIQAAIDNFNKGELVKHRLGKVRVIPNGASGAKGESTTIDKRKNHESTFDEIKDKLNEQTKDKEKLAKKAGAKVVQYGVMEAVKFGARRKLAKEIVKATFTNGVKYGGRRVAIQAGSKGLQAVSGFAFGIKAVKASNPAALASIGGELAGGYFGGLIGEELGSEKAGEIIGGLGGSVAAGALAGSVVPGLGTLAGAAAGAISFGIGKAIEGLFSLF